MNLNHLFIKQAELDAYIIKTKGLEGQDLLPNTILALQVELGECANEWRGFKHWSEDKEPRTEKLLVEYVDNLHFILSIGNQLGFDKIKYWNYNTHNNFEPHIIEEGITDQFIALIYSVNDVYYYPGEVQYYGRMFSYFIGLGSMLDFSWEEIEAAYNTKWEINKQRQENGY